METDGILLSAVQTVWAPESRFLGKTFTARLVEAAHSGEPESSVAKLSHAGDSFDLTSAIHVLYEGTQLGAVVLVAIQVLIKELGRRPSEKEVEDHLKKSKELNKVSLPVVSELTKVIAAILKLMDQHK